MKVCVLGSRHVTDADVVAWAIWESGYHVTELVSGCAPGADSLGIAWALERGTLIKRFPAKWREQGRAAGPIRNKAMARYADAFVVVWDGKSRGTADMLRQIHLQNKPYHLVMLDDWVPCDVRGWRRGLPLAPIIQPEAASPSVLGHQLRGFEAYDRLPGDHLRRRFKKELDPGPARGGGHGTVHEGASDLCPILVDQTRKDAPGR